MFWILFPSVFLHTKSFLLDSEYSFYKIWYLVFLTKSIYQSCSQMLLSAVLKKDRTLYIHKYIKIDVVFKKSWKKLFVIPAKLAAKRSRHHGFSSSGPVASDFRILVWERTWYTWFSENKLSGNWMTTENFNSFSAQHFQSLQAGCESDKVSHSRNKSEDIFLSWQVASYNITFL